MSNNKRRLGYGCRFALESREINCMRRKATANEFVPIVGCEGGVNTNEIACTLCNGCLHNATVLNCGHFFCEVCIKEYICKSQKLCPTCAVQITSVLPAPCVEKKVSEFCPFYSFFRSTYQYCREKRMVFELCSIKTKLKSVRDRVIDFHKEKRVCVNEVKRSFYERMEIIGHQNAVAKEFVALQSALENQLNLGRLLGMAGEKESAEKNKDFNLPDRACCLDTLISAMDECLVGTPDKVAEAYSKIYSSESGTYANVRCRTCECQIELLPASLCSISAPGGF